MKTKYVKVQVSERLPEKEGKYTVQRNDSEDWHEMYYFNGSPLNVSFWKRYIEYWLEEVPDHSEEMLSMLEKVVGFTSLGERVPDYLTHEIEELINKVKDNETVV